MDWRLGSSQSTTNYISIITVFIQDVNILNYGL
jgi:hypothetical protein